MATSSRRIRVKAAARSAVPQTRDEVAEDIRAIGDLQRERIRMETEMNDRIAAVTAEYQPGIDALAERIKTLQGGVQFWCESHRDELTEHGRVKSANLVTGEVGWRIRPPSVLVRGTESVIETLKRLGLERFIRIKEEINKEAVLNEPAAVQGVAGLRVVYGVEDFFIVPFEREAP
ncbi:MAG TPA: host-nuclease inhibitor Gam family protein [Methylococcus sp.]|nr:host-nuclease inhibitor Gam family protein [Methylococcus sp.]